MEGFPHGEGWGEARAGEQPGWTLTIWPTERSPALLGGLGGGAGQDIPGGGGEAALEAV